MVIQTDLPMPEAATMPSTIDMTANLERLAARALCSAGVMTRSTRAMPWSQAAKDRLYRRMFPDDSASP